MLTMQNIQSYHRDIKISLRKTWISLKYILASQYYNYWINIQFILLTTLGLGTNIHKKEKRKINIIKAEDIPLRHYINHVVPMTLETHSERPHKEETAISEYPHKEETPIMRISAQRGDGDNTNIRTKRRRRI